MLTDSARATRPLVAGAALPILTLATLVGCVFVTVTAAGEARYPVAALVPAAAAALFDIGTGRIPDRLVALTACPPVAAVLAAGPRSAIVTSVLLGAAAMAVPMLVVHLVDPDAIGFGDVKLGAALGAALGVLDATTALAGLALASGLALLVALARRRRAVAFAPFLAAGAATALAITAASGWEVAP